MSIPLTELFKAGVRAVQGEEAVVRSLIEQPLLSDEPVYLLAVGKAAGAMTQGAIDTLADLPMSGLLITKPNHTSSALQNASWLQVMESSHPVPDQASLEAGAAAVEFIQCIPNNAQLLFLLSGGASALMEHLIDGLGLSDLQELNEMLLAGGYPINEMNAMRKTLSAIKGGKLCHYLPNIPVTQLVISDVPGDVLTDIGSGPLIFPTGDAQVHPGTLLERTASPVSSEIVACVNAFGVEPPSPSHWAWDNIQTRIVASSRIAQEAVIKAAEELNLPDHCSIRSEAALNADVNETAQKIVHTLLSDKSVSLRVWGGETHCVLPENPGRGGRNQHLALAIAKLIAGDKNLRVLCCGTDGSDGPTEDAGALVTGSTVAEGEALGLSIDDYLLRADAGRYLEAVHALVTTGPTGTNVMDLVIATNFSGGS